MHFAVRISKESLSSGRKSLIERDPMARDTRTDDPKSRTVRTTLAVLAPGGCLPCVLGVLVVQFFRGVSGVHRSMLSGHVIVG